MSTQSWVFRWAAGPTSVQCALTLGVILLTAGAALAQGDRWQQVGAIDVDGLTEASGLAASRRYPGLFWVHNDSGNAAELFAIDGNGELQARLRVNAGATDWEDIAAFDWHGTPFLAIADTGDNLHWRSHPEIVLLPEPALDADVPLQPTRVLRFRYPQGAPDVEAVAVDGERGQILLLEKIVPPARLYALDLNGPDEQLARVVGELPVTIDNPMAPGHLWRSREVPTAMDIDPVRHQLAILNYRRAYRFVARSGESWAQAIARPPAEELPLPRGPWLFEALAFDPDGILWATTEGRNVPLLREARTSGP